MKIKVIAFGQIAEISGKTNWEFEEVKNTKQLAEILSKEFPILKNLQYKFAINQQLIHEHTEFQDNDIVALLPPFSGG